MKINIQYLPKWHYRNILFFNDGIIRGWSVAATRDSTTLVVGARDDDAVVAGGGSAAIYTRIRAGWSAGAWGNEIRLEAPVPRRNGHFGHSVAISGDGSVVIIGEIIVDRSQTNSFGWPDTGEESILHVYTQVGGVWTHQQQIDIPLTYGNQSTHQIRISYDGSTMVVGANDYNGKRGAMQVYNKSGTTFSLAGTLVPSGVYSSGDQFGWCVDISDDGSTAVCGAWNYNPNAPNSAFKNTGLVAVFHNNGSGWTEQGVFAGPGITTWSCFGYSVSLSADGNIMAVGANQHEITPGKYSGVVQTFTRTGGSWTHQQTIAHSAPTTTDFFGSSVRLNTVGDTLAIGAPQWPDFGAKGFVALYRFEGGSWNEKQVFTADDPDWAQNFGNSVDVGDTRYEVIVGAPYYYRNGTSNGATFVLSYY